MVGSGMNPFCIAPPQICVFSELGLVSASQHITDLTDPTDLTYITDLTDPDLVPRSAIGGDQLRADCEPPPARFLGVLTLLVLGSPTCIPLRRELVRARS